MKPILILLIIVNFYFCRSKPEIKPTSLKDSSSIVMEIATKIPLSLFGADATMSKFWLVKNDPKKKKLSELNLIESNYRSGRRVYFLNIEPGEYSLVGAYEFRKGANNAPDANYYYILNRESIKKSIFKVVPNQTLIVGRNNIEYKPQDIGVDEDNDELGMRIFPGFKDSLGKKIGLGIATALLGGSITTGGYTNLIETLKTKEIQSEIEKEVLEDFNETDWIKFPIVK